MSLNQLGLGFTFTAQDTTRDVIAGVQSNLEKTEKAADEAREKVKQYGESMERVGTGLAAIGLAGLAFLGIATAKAYEMEEALKAVRAETNEGIFPMEKMDEVANSLAARFGTLPIDQAKAMFLAVQKGARSASESEDLLSASNALAKVSHIELGQAIDTTTQLLRAYGLGFEKSGEVADKLYEASLQGKTSVGELGGVLEHVAPSAARLGIGMDELLGSIGAMSAAGLQGRPALAGLKGVVDALIAPSKEATIEAARLGIAFDEQTVKAKGLPAVLASIGNNPHFNKNTLKELFGSVEVGTAALALMKDKGQALAGAVGEIGASMGRTAEEAEALVTPEARFAALKETALQLIGKALLPLVDTVSRIGNAFLSAFNKIPQPVITAGVVIAALAFALLFVAGTGVAAAGAFLAMDGALAPLLVTTVAVLSGMAALAALMAIIAIPVVAVLYAMKVALDKNIGGIRDTFDAAYTKIKLIWDALVQVFRDGGFSGQVLKDLDKAGNEGVQPFVVKVFVWANRIEGFFIGIRDGFQEVMKTMGPVFSALGQAFDALGSAIGDAFSGPNDPKTNADKFHSFVEAGVMVAQAIGLVVRVIVYMITGLVYQVGYIVRAIRFVIDVWGHFKDAALSAIAAVMPPLEVLGGIAGKVAGYLGIKGGAPAPGAPVATSGGLPVAEAVSQPRPSQPKATAGETQQEAATRVLLAAQGNQMAGKGTANDRETLTVMQGILAQLKANGGQPVMVHLDGEKIADVVARRNGDNANREFSPHPMPG